jgi:hypothetical protein
MNEKFDRETSLIITLAKLKVLIVKTKYKKKKKIVKKKKKK